MRTIYHIYLPGKDMPETKEIDWPKKSSYALIKTILEPIFGPGQWTEHVSVLHDNRRKDMFVDENGHTRGLQRNEAATKIYRANYLSQYPKTDPEMLAWIVGPAVLFDRIVWT